MIPVLDPAQLFGLRVGLGVLVGGWLITWAALQHPATRVRQWWDVYLGSLATAIIGARIGYVLLHAEDFISQPERVLLLWYGELSWIGALLGGGLAMIILCRWRKIPLRAFADGAALALPIGFMAVWWGCRGAGCGVGAVVSDPSNYPVWQVGYLRDLTGDVFPRYELQMGAIFAGAVMLALMGWLTLQNRLVGRRIWISLLLIFIAMLTIEGVSQTWTKRVLGGG